MDNPRTPPPPPPPPKAPPSHPHLTRTTSANVLDKYELGRVLGRGSFAKVYAAKSLRELNKDGAIKVIDKSRVVPAMERRVICEIIAMKRLQHHPNILKIYEVMATKTKIYLVMDLAAGGELFSKILHRGKLKEPAARRLFQQLVSALHFCHQNGVAHRDLKPQNLLLDAQGNLKISDFGLSALAEANGVLHTACGTPAFAAPEVMARRGYDGAKADAWSCGVILFFLLSNCLPFDDSNLVTMYKKIYKREYSMPSCISKPAKSVISQLLEPNPKRRMSTEELMNHPWLVKKLELPRPRSMFELRGYEGKECMINDALSINAFDIISLSSGLDLSGLFEVSNRKDKRFTSRKRVEDVKERLTEVGGKLGYKVEEGKDGVIGFGKGRLALVFEVLMIVERIAVVEVKVVEGGGVEFDEAHWRELEDGLQDVVLQWNHQEVVRSKDQSCCSVEVDDARWTESEEGP